MIHSHSMSLTITIKLRKKTKQISQRMFLNFGRDVERFLCSRLHSPHREEEQIVEDPTG